MPFDFLPLIFFFYGLAFFSMGLAIVLELAQCSDQRLRHALRPLAAFGFIHGFHEWLEMFGLLNMVPTAGWIALFWTGVKLALLSFSFLSLAEFGSSLLAKDERTRRISLLLPLSLAAIWGLGVLVLRSHYPPSDIINVADVWTRYVIAIPASLVACVGLVMQQREFRRAGLAQFGQDSLWAAIAFAWYGLIGQSFARTSLLPPSTIINSDLFQRLFGIPIQLLRAGAAGVAALFVIRFLRSFEVEVNHQITTLQTAQIQEAQRKENLRGQLLKRVVEAQESERQRIARELHDETGQALTAIGLGLRGVGSMIAQNSDKATQNLRHLEALVDHSLDELQRLIADLRPSHLDDLGLAAALRWYVGEVQHRTALTINLEFLGDQQDLPSETKTALFRIAQEAITNIVRHANADHAWIRLIFTDQTVRLQVEDDGSGFDKNIIARTDRPSWGLEGMRERAVLLEGQLLLDSIPGRGTRVEVVLPYQTKKEKVDDNTSFIS